MTDTNTADFANGFISGQTSANGNGNNGNGWGQDWIWIIVVLACLWGGFGNGGWGNGNGGGGNGSTTILPYALGASGAVTRADLCSEFNFNGLESSVRGVQQGLCDGFYAVNTSLLNGFNGVDNAVCSLGYQTQQSINGVTNAISELGYNVQGGFNATQVAMMQGQNALQTQLAQCCCDNRAGQKDIQYQMATDTCAIQNTIQNTTRDIIDTNNNNTKQILDFMVTSRMQDLQSENQTLKLAASQAAQNTYLINELRPCAKPAYITCSPFQSAYGLNGLSGYGTSGCGCS